MLSCIQGHRLDPVALQCENPLHINKREIGLLPTHWHQQLNLETWRTQDFNSYKCRVKHKYVLYTLVSIPGNEWADKQADSNGCVAQTRRLTNFDPSNIASTFSQRQWKSHHKSNGNESNYKTIVGRRSQDSGKALLDYSVSPRDWSPKSVLSSFKRERTI